jgi:hypothetical protein
MAMSVSMSSAMANMSVSVSMASLLDNDHTVGAIMRSVPTVMMAATLLDDDGFRRRLRGGCNGHSDGNSGNYRKRSQYLFHLTSPLCALCALVVCVQPIDRTAMEG